MKYFLRHIAQMHLPTALLLSVGALAMWTVDYIRTPEQWFALLLAQILVILNAGLLCAVLYRAKAASHFSLMPAVLYIVAVAVYPYLRLHWQPQLIVLLLLFFLFMTRDIFGGQNGNMGNNGLDANEPNSLVFFVTILLCLTSLLVPDALWCIAFLWIVVLLQGAFSFRTVLASLLAVALVCVYYVLAIYTGWVDMWDYAQLFDRQWLGYEQPACITTSVLIMMPAFLLITAGAFRRSSYDLVSTRMLLYHVVMLGLFAAPLILLAAARQDIIVLLPLSLAATTGIFLLQKESETRGVTLLLYLLGAVTMYFWLVYSL